MNALKPPPLLLSLLLATITSATWGEQMSPPDLTTLSLQDLLAVELISASKKPQALSQVAAAAFVITAKDIRRSSASSIPELLRVVPGLQVARIDANKWAITSRGSNGRFANKLLVLMDGRSVYTPLFAGVYWDIQDTVLEDIERIEVIRGPGATLWGSNAVNGVINIITKTTKDTQGTLLSTGFGSEEQGFGTLRFGGQWDENTHYRLYGKYFQQDGSAELHGRDHLADDWSMGRGGFRIDRELANSQLTLQGDLYHGNIGETITTFDPVPLLRTSDEQQKVEGGNLLFRWQQQLSDRSSLSLQLYYDRAERQSVLFGELRDTFDIEFQHRLKLGDQHELLWGLGYRYTQDEVSTSNFIGFIPDHRSDEIRNAFIQDDIQLTENLRLTVGSKFEKNDFTGFNSQPNLRLLWSPNDRHSLWASVAKALRTPSRGEHDGLINNLEPVIQVPAPGVPIVITILGDGTLEDEELRAYELGYRFNHGHDYTFDLAYFYHDYQALRSSAVANPVCQPLAIPVTGPGSCLSTAGATHIMIPSVLSNAGEGWIQGLELAFDWRPNDRWQIQAAYTYQRTRFNSNAQLLVAENPENQFSLRVSMPISQTLRLDLQGRYVDEFGNLTGAIGARIDDYIGLDATLTWSLRKNIALSLIGRDLLEGRHAEFVSELGDIPQAEIERSLFGRLRWEF